jgi:hypothetical protein
LPRSTSVQGGRKLKWYLRWFVSSSAQIFPIRSEPDLATINRALPADELAPFVEKLPHRIASFPAHAIAHAKVAVDTGAFNSMAEGLLVEAPEADLSVVGEVTQARVTEGMEGRRRNL